LALLPCAPEAQGFSTASMKPITLGGAYTLALASDKADCQREDYKLGLVTNLYVLSALRTMQDTRLALWQARIRANGAQMKLENAAGVGDVDMGGFVDPSLRIWLNVDELNSKQLRKRNERYLRDTTLGGVSVGKFSKGGKRYDIRLRLVDKDRKSPGDIGKFNIPDAAGGTMRLQPDVPAGKPSSRRQPQTGPERTGRAA